MASSRNSTKHGLASGTLIIPGEDLAEFNSLVVALLNEHQPAGETEELLIQEMAQSHWLAQRAIRLQNTCFTEEGVNEKRLSLFLRYFTTHNRAFHKALADLQRLQKGRRKAGGGFVSQNATNQSPDDEFVRQNDLPPARDGGIVSQNASRQAVEAAQSAKEAA